MLKVVLPKGSLERATLDLFEDADLSVQRSSDVAYRATVADPRIDEVRILRPQEIPRYVAEGLFDLGVTGRDWIEETASDVVSLGELEYSKVTSNPFLIRCNVEKYELTIFKDGRAIVQGTKDPAMAKTVYAKYVGV